MPRPGKTDSWIRQRLLNRRGRCQWSIPACAGETGGVTVAGWTIWVYPCVCGGNAAVLAGLVRAGQAFKGLPRVVPRRANLTEGFLSDGRADMGESQR